MDIHTLKRLRPKQFEKAHNEWVQQEMMFDWYEPEIDTLKEKYGAITIGENAYGEPDIVSFDIQEIYFRGFWSQGDGAAVEGSMRLWEFMCLQGWHTAHPLLYEAVKAARVYAHTKQYNYNLCQSSSLEDSFYELPNTTAPAGMFEGMDVDEWSALLDEEIDTHGGGLETLWQEFCTDTAAECYRALESEYEYVTSEAAFIEYCEANEETFDDEE